MCAQIVLRHYNAREFLYSRLNDCILQMRDVSSLHLSQNYIDLNAVVLYVTSAKILFWDFIWCIINMLWFSNTANLWYFVFYTFFFNQNIFMLSNSTCICVFSVSFYVSVLLMFFQCQTIHIPMYIDAHLCCIFGHATWLPYHIKSLE